jgi:hypothetical protein
MPDKKLRGKFGHPHRLLNQIICKSCGDRRIIGGYKPDLAWL